jgi:HPt (histidine-containing phosphotransfer) domain-containing protein
MKLENIELTKLQKLAEKIQLEIEKEELSDYLDNLQQLIQ